jgi:AraC-like DNA-binding protein
MKMDVRLEKAASLLRASDAKIIDVAMECGFTHLGLFSAKFRQRYGARPSEWRRSDAASVPDRVVSMVTGERALAGVA